MNKLAKRQDFENYADQKTFNYGVNKVWEEKLDEILRQKDISPDSLKVLDDGCGDGKLYPNLLRKGFSKNNIYGVEVSQKRVQRCHEIGFENAIYLPLKTKRPYEENYFDIINYLEVIEHVPADEMDFYLAEMVRMLKQDGSVVITTPNYPIKRVIDIYDAFVHRRWSRLKDDPTHVTFYTHKSLKERLEQFFGKVEVYCYKEGLFYKRFKSPYLMHKLIAVCSQPLK